MTVTVTSGLCRHGSNRKYIAIGFPIKQDLAVEFHERTCFNTLTEICNFPKKDKKSGCVFQKSKAENVVQSYAASYEY